MIINVTQQVEQITINASQNGNSVTLQPTIIVGSSGGGGGTGDMTKAVYDPQNIEADAFDRSNHTGTQDVSTITGLGDLATLNQVDTDEITNNAVTNLKLANMNSNTVKGRLSGNGTPQDVSMLDLPISNSTQNALDSKVDKVAGQGLSDENYTLTEKNKLAGIETGAEVNDVNSVNTQTGDVVLDADDISDATTTNKFTTQADIDRLANTSGTNTGDQDISGKADKRTDKAVSSGTYTLLASDVDKHLMVSAPCTVVVPNGLASNLEFQGEQVGGDDIDVISFVAESGGTLNVTAAFQAKTDNEFSVFGIRTHGSDVATLYGTLKLAE